jgi:uncharacterized repeat protein (TIGR03803 family)
MYRFAGPPDDGDAPYGGLILSNGRLYGMAAGGGIESLWGTIYSINPDGTDYAQLHDFTGKEIANDGAWPHGALFALGDRLYGMTFAGGCDANNCVNADGTGCGTAFGIGPDGAGYSVLWRFSCGSGDQGAAMPDGAFVSDGTKLYGTTAAGGSNNPFAGVVFSMDPDGTGFTLLHEFDGADGLGVTGGLLLNGNTLYGMTFTGDPNTDGTIFSVGTDGSGFATIHNFSSDTDGSNPCGTLTLYNGRLYGTALYGGTNGDGTIFSVNPGGTGFEVIHNFNDPEGSQPYEGVTIVDGILYGVTASGGSINGGVLYSLKPDGAEYTVLHDVTNVDQGFWSDAKLVYSDGYLYGTSSHGGVGGRGVIFSYDLQGGPTPTPTPTPSDLRLILSSQTPRPGDTFTVDVALDPVAGAFDAYAGIAMPDGTFYSFTQGGGLRKGVSSLASKVKGLRGTYTARLFTGTVPNAQGTYLITAGLVPEGVKPSIANAIPEYLDQKMATVQ